MMQVDHMIGGMANNIVFTLSMTSYHIIIIHINNRYNNKYNSDNIGIFILPK